jgi:hypothetical protein
MNNPNYLDEITQQSQVKFNLMKEKMLEPIREMEQKSKENLRNLITEIERKQNLLQTEKISLEKLCRE